MKSFTKIAIGGVALMLTAASSAMAGCYQQDEFHYNESGWGNEFDLTLDGRGIYVSADQHGAYNRTTGTLRGCGHSGVTYQQGVGNDFHAEVSGREHSYGVVQRGGGVVNLSMRGERTAVGVYQETAGIINITTNGVGGTVRVHSRR